MDYINIKFKKFIILSFIIIFLIFSIYIIFEKLYFTRWKIVYYGESDNFEGEFLLLPSKIDKEAKIKLKKNKIEIIAYYCEIWIKTKSYTDITLQINGKDLFELFSFEKDIKINNTDWDLIFKTFIAYEKNSKINDKDNKIILNIEFPDNKIERLEIKYLTSFPLLYKAPFLPPCKLMLFNPYDSNFVLP